MRIERGSIHYVDFGETDGSSVQKGVRPGLIIQNNLGNRFSTTTVAIPLSTKNKGMPTHTEIDLEDCLDGRLASTSYALCEQISVIDRDDVHTKICDVNEDVLEQVEECMMIEFGFIKPSKSQQRRQSELV
ncbi:mRNA interferase MazF [Alkalibacillus flavidus]|uniref:mRNA interferase MazF n=1 Tax=Alkalibacillus flavidus TaxID=546021 RepID=A0ABV2KTM1_9BACI